MEPQDLLLIEKLIVDDPKLKDLVETHRKYEAVLEEMNQRPYLSPEDDLERKRLQKNKLAGKDQIENILAAHRG